MTVTDLDEWLRPGATHDEVTLEVEDAATGVALQATLSVIPNSRSVRLTVAMNGLTIAHRAAEAGPPTANWDRMAIGGVEWRMVEPLQQWEFSADEPESGLRAYLVFTGTSACVLLDNGYEQHGVVSGQLRFNDQRATVADAPARRAHTWDMGVHAQPIQRSNI